MKFKNFDVKNINGGVTARLEAAQVPRLASVEHYLGLGCVPGGTLRNYDSYGERIGALDEAQKHLLCDPQTSGGLLVAVAAEAREEFLALAAELGLELAAIGEMVERQARAVEVY